MTKVVSSPDGVPILYEVQGTGTVALVFVHGWSCDRTYWRRQLEWFSRDFLAAAVDLAGHGESGLGREAWTIGAFGGDVAAVVGELGPKQVILIGHSMGGDVIVEAARRLSGRIAGLVPEGGVPWPSSHPESARRHSGLSRPALHSPQSPSRSLGNVN